MSERRDGLQEIMDKAPEGMAAEAGEGLDPQACDLADFCRRTGLTRSRARATEGHGLRVLPHGNAGRKAGTAALAGHAGPVDDLLGRGAASSRVICERLVGQGCRGGLTGVRVYVAARMDLVPARGGAVAPRGSRGQRFVTGPGQACQTGWGPAAVVGLDGAEHKMACLAMVCRHRGSPHVGLFPDARRGSLTMGMVHAFMAVGIPGGAPADSVRSVVVRRDLDGRPVWQRDYAEPMGCVGFRARPRRPRRPLAKGEVERLVRFVRGDFLAGGDLTDVTAPDEDAALWCAGQAGRWRRAVACVPAEEHGAACRASARELGVTEGVAPWPCPRRGMTLDGLVGCGGRGLGVPWWYERRDRRVSREGRHLHIHGDDLSRGLVAHAVAWDRRDSRCEGRRADARPEGLPGRPVTTSIAQAEPSPGKPAFAKSGFGRWA